MKKKIVVLLKAAGLIGLVLSLLFVVDGKPLGAAEPIKIGVVLCVTGRGGFLGTPQKEAITVAVEEVNRQGGIFGRPIELYIEDDQSNPTNSAVAATKLIRDKKVCCVVGSSLVVACMAMIPICEREQVPHIPLPPLTIPFQEVDILRQSDRLQTCSKDPQVYRRNVGRTEDCPSSRDGYLRHEWSAGCPR